MSKTSGTMTADDAIAYLNKASDSTRANLGKIRAALDALEPGKDAYAADWNGAVRALDGVSDWNPDNPGDREGRADAREELCAMLGSLLGAIEDAAEPVETPPVTEVICRECGDVGLKVSSPGPGRVLIEILDVEAAGHAPDVLRHYIGHHLGIPSLPDVTSAVTGRLCACGCGQPVTSPRPEARYATGACRVRAHRARIA